MALKSRGIGRLLSVGGRGLFRPRAKAKPMNSVQVAEALLGLEGAATLAELFSSGRKCDAIPVQFVMLRMFPDTRYEDLAAGLRLAVTLARLDEAEVQAGDMLSWQGLPSPPPRAG